MILNFIFKISSRTIIVKKILRGFAEEPKAPDSPPARFLHWKTEKWHRPRSSKNLLRKDGGGMVGGKPSLSAASKSLSIPPLDGEGSQDEWPTTESAMRKAGKAAERRASP